MGKECSVTKSGAVLSTLNVSSSSANELNFIIIDAHLSSTVYGPLQYDTNCLKSVMFYFLFKCRFTLNNDTNNEAPTVHGLVPIAV